jgi:hypothetical protein
MALSINYIVQDPGTTNFYRVTLNESSRSEVTPKTQALDCIEQILDDDFESANHTISAADITSIATAAIAAMGGAGLF